ncbi:MAG TPA: hypothetical protein VJ486_13335 [Geothrix sp.]|nr:hypothetical protein [Geothrix sp.]
MPLIVIESSNLSPEQEARIGDRIINALQQEGLAPSSVVVMFRPERGDLYVDGQLFLGQAARSMPTAPAAPRAVPAEPVAVPMAIRAKGRLTKAESEDLKKKLTQALQEKGSLSSFEAQVALDLKDCDWAPGTLRRLFTELEDAKFITKSGQKRGTRYVWKGIVNAPQSTPTVKLVKADEA